MIRRSDSKTKSHLGISAKGSRVRDFPMESSKQKEHTSQLPTCHKRDQSDLGTLAHQAIE